MKNAKMILAPAETNGLLFNWGIKPALYTPTGFSWVRSGKYTRHQGVKECARRRAQQQRKAKV